MRRFALASLCVVCFVCMSGFASPARAASFVALVDSCGTQPDFWSDPLGWSSWQACELAAGTGATITNVASPVLDTISNTLGGIQSGLTDVRNAVGGVAGSVVNGVTAFLLPSQTDLQPIKSELDTILLTREPFLTITTLVGRMQTYEGQWASSGAISGLTDPASLPTVGPGVKMFFDFLALAGMSQSTLAAVISASFVLTTVSSILVDLGVRMGRIAPGTIPWVGSGASVVPRFRSQHAAEGGE